MSTIYEKAPVECYNICEEMMKKYHGDLIDLGVTVDLLFATLSNDSKPGATTLKLRGYRVGGICKINSYKLRVQGHADAEITIDGDAWRDYTPAIKYALIDHELEHIEPKENKDGEQQYDDLGRPRLACKLHSHQFGWFDCVARRHGNDSFEVMQFKDFCEQQPALWTPEPEVEPADQGDSENYEEMLANSIG